MGGASVINIIVGLIRMKVAAVMLGPAGVGLVGLLQQLMSVASTVAGMGVGIAGTRQIAETASHEEQSSIATTQRALLWATVGLALVGALLFWIFREPLSRLIFGDTDKAKLVGWLSIGVALSVATGSQGAMLTGLRRIGDVARISILSAIISTLAIVPALLIWGEQAVLVLLLGPPTASFIFGYVFVARLPKYDLPRPSLADLKQQVTTLLKLGSTFMLSGLFTIGGQLAVRTLVQKELGAENLGYFTATWTLSVTYMGFVLGAMGTDYFPRLTAVIHNKETANRLVNDQTEVALLLAGPVLVAVMGLAPLIINIFYSSAFTPASEILRWQIMGDILKVMSWPLGMILVASGAGKTFILTEFIGNGVYVLCVALGLSLFGVKATGMAFFMTYIVYLPLVWWMGVRRIGFRWSRPVKLNVVLIFCTTLLVAYIANWSELGASAAGLTFAVILGIVTLIRLASITNTTGRLSMLARLGEKISTWTR